MSENMNQPEYDEATCITAGELRAAGIQVPPDIPNCGWIPRSSIQIGQSRASADPATRRLDVSIEIAFPVPFRWINVNMTIEDEAST